MIIQTEFKSPYYNLKSLIGRKGTARTIFNLKINRTNGRDFTFQETITIARILNEKIELFY